MKRTEIQNKLKQVKNSLSKAVEENNLVDVEKHTAEANSLIKELEILDNADLIQNKLNGVVVNGITPIVAKKDNITTFFNTLKKSQTNKVEFLNIMSQNGNEMIMPEDVVKEIREKRVADGSLEDLISWENPTALKGSRTLEVEDDSDGLFDIDEDSNTEIGDVDSPKFKLIKFSKKTMAGLLRVSNSLLEDSVPSLKAFIIKNLSVKGKKSLRKKILTIADTFTKKTVQNLDEVKKVIEVDLDTAYLEGSIVLIGQEMFNKIGNIKDSDGKYLLQADPTQAGVKLLFGLPVKVVTKKVLSGNKFYIGNFKEGISGFGDMDIRLALSIEAGFCKNQTIFRCIERFDIVKAFDDALYVLEWDETPAQ